MNRPDTKSLVQFRPQAVLPLLLTLTFTAAAFAADPPGVDITNGQIKAHIYLPDTKNGYYRSTRFDWSGIITNLEYKGHVFYTPWFDKTDLNVYDLGYEGQSVISAPFTAMVGPGEEFNHDGNTGTGFSALGFTEAKPGGTFLKIGVGVLRKPMAGEPPIPVRPVNNGPARAGAAPDPDRYDHSRLYEIVDSGKWTVKIAKDSVEFTQVINDDLSGYGYVYKKTVRLVQGKPAMTIAHTLTNTGKKPIQGTVYNHNFLVVDGKGPTEGTTITVPFQIQSPRPPTAGLLEVRGNQLVYLKTLTDQERGQATLRGFGDTAADYDIRVENKAAGAGYHVTGDKPVANIAVWSIRTVTAIEPFVPMDIAPGKSFDWTLSYDYFTTGK